MNELLNSILNHEETSPMLVSQVLLLKKAGYVLGGIELKGADALPKENEFMITHMTEPGCGLVTWRTRGKLEQLICDGHSGESCMFNVADIPNTREEFEAMEGYFNEYEV